MTAVQSRRDPGGWHIRWNAELASQARANGDWADRTIADFAQQRARNFPDRVQIVDGPYAKTCAELLDAAARLAGYFQSLGLRPGEVVSFQLPNWWETIVIDLAASFTGVVTNPIVPINRDSEVRYMLEESKSRVMFLPGVFRKFDYAAMMRRVLPSLSRAPELVLVRAESEGMISLDHVLRSSAPAIAAAVDPDCVKLLMYTSGTTGRPKGVLHSHNTFLADGLKLKRAMKLEDENRLFCPSPVTHISGYLWALTTPWTGGMPVVVQDVWEPEVAFDLMASHDCAFMVGATPFLQDLVAVAKRRGSSLPRLKSFMCGGAAVPPSLIYEAAEIFSNCIPWRTFGATEAPTITGPPQDRTGLKHAAETDGQLLGSEVKIVDIATGAALPAGEEGEILVREPSMAMGYSRPEDNEGCYDSHGYFRMGDIGRLLPGGHLLCTGRKKDLIIRAGENISAKEIEDVLHRSALVAEAAVVSMPSAKTGEAICAFIVAREGASLDLTAVSQMIEAAGLARQKTPEHVALVPELPKTPSGKVRKDQLRLAARSFDRS